MWHGCLVAVTGCAGQLRSLCGKILNLWKVFSLTFNKSTYCIRNIFRGGIREFKNARKYFPPIPMHECNLCMQFYTALIWQKEASDKSDISRKRAKCVCHLHWRQWNIRMSYLTYLLVGWVFLHEIWRRRRAHYVNYENINNSNLDGMSLASFCQSRAV